MILITGGTRSGKTAAAEKLCKAFGQRVLYLAVTIPSDPDTKEKIKRSRGHRPYYWDTYEISSNIIEVISEKGNDYDVILIDSVNNLVFNLIAEYSEESESTIVDYRSAELKILAYIRSVLEICQKQKSDFVFVSTEMGSGMAATSSLNRAYCEISGRVNQLLAEACTSVYCIVCGISTKIK